MRFLLYLSLCILVVSSNHYKILGLKSGSNLKQIKKAYRKLALKYHPDKCKDSDKKCKDRFIKITKAYEVLSDSKKKAAYDDLSRNQKTSPPNFNQNFNVQSNFDLDLANLFPYHQRSTKKNLKVKYLTENYFPDGNSNKHLWLVLLCSHRDPKCRQLLSYFNLLPNVVRGLAKVGTIDCHQYLSKCRKYGSQFPLIVKILPKNSILKTKFGNFITYPQVIKLANLVKSLIDFIYDSLISKTTIYNIRNRRHLNSFIDRCRAHSRKKCLLLFTDKHQILPIHRALGYQNDNLVMAECRAGSDIHDYYHVKRFPSAILLDSKTSTQIKKLESRNGQYTLSNLLKLVT